MNATILQSLGPQDILFIVIVIFVIIASIIGIQRVPEARGRLVERFGKYHRTLSPGIHFIIPFLDNIKKNIELNTYVSDEDGVKTISLTLNKTDVNLAEIVIDPPAYDCIANDNATVLVDTIIYFQISDVSKAVYAVVELGQSLRSLIETTLRQQVANLDSDSLITSRETVSAGMRSSLEEATSSWGLVIRRVEIESIQFSKDVQDKLSHAREAELVRRSELIAEQQKRDTEVLAAEGEKKAAILKAEGEKESQVLIAEGKFEAQRLEAEGKFLLVSREQEGVAQGYAAINQALSERPDALIAIESLKAQIEVAKGLGSSNNLLVVPSETAGLFGAAGAIIKGLSELKSREQS
jgi:regulator of protease activity HflC (stomatin/prohibitin superfamily)